MPTQPTPEEPQAGHSYTDMIQDFLRLRDLAEHPSCRQFLNDMVNGLHREFTDPEAEANPFLVPVGPADATSITVVNVEGKPTSVWFTNSWSQRLKFLLTGRIAVIYPSAETIVPLCLRTDLEQLGIAVIES